MIKKRITKYTFFPFEKEAEQVDIFSTDKLKASSTELLEIQQEVLKKYVNINPILVLSEYLIEEYNKKNEDKKTSE
ncbi:hypothetical protein AK88_00343 [Plasmodium fragile]|uniref:Uncharacterized protein n=1 Tax=Plasmodium fragile TaxID=5857 RepID=A0A0D9QSR2_PLAFR|nr:uncharacterized protein AK88_00343 [Plasmodium fragile]KJP89887.1 hypothetical protein AK88_00343 [Plasmodium fragile]